MVWNNSSYDGGGGIDGGGISLDGVGGGMSSPCRISTAVYGFCISKEIWTLALLSVSVLIVYHKIRAKFKK